MVKSEAREFIEKMYNDEETMREVLLLTDAPEKIKAGVKESEEQQYKNFAMAAGKLGYFATPEEFQKATKEYFEEIGSMESIAKVFHVIEVASELVKRISRQEG